MAFTYRLGGEQKSPTGLGQAILNAPHFCPDFEIVKGIKGDRCNEWVRLEYTGTRGQGGRTGDRKKLKYENEISGVLDGQV